MDRNHVGLSDLSGLDLVEGHAVWVHYTPAQEGLVRSFTERTGLPVLALSERSGVVREEGGIRSGGFEPVLRFEGGKVEEI
jgi:hypothetical protein